MRLKDCKLGEVVTDGVRIGHIVGFSTRYPIQDRDTRIKQENVIPLVKFGGEFEEIAIHQGNIEKYKGNL